MSLNSDIHQRHRSRYAEPVTGRLTRKCLVSKETDMGFGVRDAVVYLHSVVLDTVSGLE